VNLVSYAPCEIVMKSAEIRRSELKMEYPELRIHEIDVVAHPLLTWNQGIRIFPALKADDQILSGVILGQEEIRRFITEQLAMQKGS